MTPPKPAPGAGSGARFTLRQLEAFATVVRLGGVSPAAAHLARTQSAVSMAIQDLESALDTRLFTRRGRRLVPTGAADRLLPRALEMIDRSRDIAGLMAADHEHLVPVAIGASRTIGPALMPALIHDCHEQTPTLRISLTVGNSEDLLARVRSFELDCAFVEGDVTDSGLECAPWGQDRLCLVARVGHPLHTRRGAFLKRLGDQSWVLRERGSGSREIFLRAIEPLIGSPEIAVEVNEPETQKRIVRETDLITCMSARAIDPHTDAVREIVGPGPELRRALTRRFWIVRHPQRYRHEAVKRVIDTALRMVEPARPGPGR
ncbi:MAG: LysR substrate-binding domain-containing protein [Burkholderiaceae bacterium]